MRRIIAALQVSLDGYIEGLDGELDWISTWDDPFDIVGRIDACVLGGVMYPGYEAYWSAVLANPTAPVPFTGRQPTDAEVAYARFASRTPHVVLSTRLEHVNWQHTRIVRNISEIARLKWEPGMDIHAVGGASLVSSLINAALVDDLRVILHPVLLGRGKPLFAGVERRHRLALAGTRQLEAGRVEIAYTT
jgi:dihydrofolate reductase